MSLPANEISVHSDVMASTAALKLSEIAINLNCFVNHTALTPTLLLHFVNHTATTIFGTLKSDHLAAIST